MDELEDGEDYNGLIDRFEALANSGQISFFDVDEFEFIAQHFFHEGNEKLALKAIEMAARIHPGESTFPLMQAQFFMDKNNFRKARVTLKQAELLDPQNPELVALWGSFYAQQGHFEKALPYLEKAMEQQDMLRDFYETGQQLANVYMALEKPQPAIALLKELLEMLPDDEVFMFLIKTAFDMQGDQQVQLEFFQNFVDQNPYSEIGWYNLGLSQLEMERYEEALRSFDFAVLIDDYFAAAYFEKGRTQELLNDFEGAIKTYMSGFEFFDPNGYAYLRIASCYRQLKKYKQAKNYFSKALKLDKDLDEAHLEMAVLSLDEENHYEAVFHIKEAVALNHDNPDYHIVAANIFRQVGLYLEAEQHYQKAMSLGFNEPDIYMDYAELLFDMDELDLAVELLRKGANEHPTAVELLVMTAGVLIEVEERQEGFAYLQTAMNLSQLTPAIFSEQFPELLEDMEVILHLNRNN
jgi:tetratricopeptide (TPR) repeat protein